MPPILFYGARGSLAGFSNFSQHPVDIYGRRWPSSEHAFQAQKFHPHRPDLVERVRTAATSREAANLGRNRRFPLAADWEKPLSFESLSERVADYRFLETADTFRATTPLFERLKDIVMYEIVYAKVTQHGALRAQLLETGSEDIVEASPVDAYWGWGRDQKGVNKLGRIFMVIRDALRESTTAGRPMGKPACVSV